MELRLAERSDVEGILRIYHPIVIESPTSFELQPPDEDEMWRRVQQVLTSYPWLVALDGDAIAGYAYATRFRGRAAYDWCAETSVYVSPEYHRRGIARALYRTLLDWLMGLRVNQVIAGITLPNAASVAFHESLGFEPVGVFSDVGHKFDQWHDVGFWQLTVTESQSADPVRSMADVSDAEAARYFEAGSALLYE